jgi:hypothetical protein
MNGTGTRATSRVSGEATPVAHGTREYREKHGHHPTLAGALGEVVLEKPSSFRAWFFFQGRRWVRLSHVATQELDGRPLDRVVRRALLVCSFARLRACALARALARSTFLTRNRPHPTPPRGHKVLQLTVTVGARRVAGCSTATTRAAPRGSGRSTSINIHQHPPPRHPRPPPHRPRQRTRATFCAAIASLHAPQPPRPSTNVCVWMCASRPALARGEGVKLNA